MTLLCPICLVGIERPSELTIREDLPKVSGSRCDMCGYESIAPEVYEAWAAKVGETA